MPTVRRSRIARPPRPSPSGAWSPTRTTSRAGGRASSASRTTTASAFTQLLRTAKGRAVRADFRRTERDEQRLRRLGAGRSRARRSSGSARGQDPRRARARPPTGRQVTLTQTQRLAGCSRFGAVASSAARRASSSTRPSTGWSAPVAERSPRAGRRARHGVVGLGLARAPRELPPHARAFLADELGPLAESPRAAGGARRRGAARRGPLPDLRRRRARTDDAPRVSATPPGAPTRTSSACARARPDGAPDAVAFPASAGEVAGRPAGLRRRGRRRRALRRRHLGGRRRRRRCAGPHNAVRRARPRPPRPPRSTSTRARARRARARPARARGRGAARAPAA